MFRHALRHRFAFWAIAFAMLLKAAMPMLASASADLRGLTLVEVCTVYGVATVALEGSEPAGEHTAAHSAEHCTLTALGAWATAPADTPSGLLARPQPSHVQALAASHPPRDASAAWLTRLKHGPPVLS